MMTFKAKLLVGSLATVALILASIHGPVGSI
jgi:hypothetical protein